MKQMLLFAATQQEGGWINFLREIAHGSEDVDERPDSRLAAELLIELNLRRKGAAQVSAITLNCW